MAFVPYERLIMRASLSPQAVCQRLAERVGREDYWTGYSRKQKPYAGWIEGDHFKINKNTRYRDSLLPVIIGDIRAEPPGSAIEIRMRPAVAALVVLAWGIVIPAALGLSLLVSALSAHNFHGAWWAPLLMMLLWYTVCTGWFRLEVLNARGFFEELFVDLSPEAPARTTPALPPPRPWVGGTQESNRYGRSDPKEPKR
jgi:hypothetical protein